MATKPDVKLSVGAYTSKDVNLAPIYQDIQTIRDNINKNPPKITLGLNHVQTAKNLRTEINKVIDSLKIKPVTVKFNLQTNTVAKSAKETPEASADAKGTRDLRKALGGLQIDSTADKTLAQISKSISSLGAYASDAGLDLKELHEQLAVLRSASKGIVGGTAGEKELQDYATAANYYSQAVKNLQTSLVGIGQTRGAASTYAQDENKLRGLINELQKYEQVNNRLHQSTGASKDYNELFGSMNAALQNKTFDSVQLNKFSSDWKELKRSIHEAGLEGQTFATKLGAQVQKLGVYFSAAGLMMGAWQQVKQMTDNVIKLDTAMTELKKVTTETDQAYEKFLVNAEGRAKSLGATLIDTVNATADFARLGFSIGEAEQVADAALVYKNVGDGIKDVGDASASIISSMKAFGIEASDAMSIVDRFNAVGNQFAITSADIGEGMKRSSSALAVAGNSIDQSIALLVAGNNVVQDADVVATALKTSALRLTNTKGKLEELGEDADGAAESITQLQTRLLNLTGQEVNIMLDSETFKSTYQIMLEMSKVWEDMNQKDQMEALDLMFGKRGANVGSSILTNMGDAEKVLAASLDSSGSALKENEFVIDSIQGRLNKLSATYEAFSNTVVDSDWIKALVTGGTIAISVLDGIFSMFDSDIGSIVRDLILMTAAVVGLTIAYNKLGIAQAFSNVGGGKMMSLVNNVPTMLCW